MAKPRDRKEYLKAYREKQMNDPLLRAKYEASQRKYLPKKLERYEANWDAVRAYQRQYKRSRTGKLTSVKYSAARRELAWDITDDEAWEMLTSACAYCGDVPELHGTLDRIDSSGGYVPGNINPACLMCNIMKNKYSIEEFKKKIKKIYDHINGVPF